jgi:hypothetical protein
VEEIIEDAEIVQRVAALDIGKATLSACVRVPHEDKPGRRLQEVRTFATTTAALLGLRDWLSVGGQPVDKLAAPTPTQRRAFDLIGAPIPLTLT